MMKRIVYAVCGVAVGTLVVFSASGCTQKLKQENAKLTAQVADLQKRADGCQQEKTALQTQVGQLNQSVSQLTQEKADLQKKVDDLSKKPGGKKVIKKKK